MIDIKDFFNKEFTYAIVGASNNEQKYGYKILKTLIDSGFNVIPINPKETSILELKAYSSLNDVKEKIDVVDFVVPPQITLKLLEEVKELKIEKVWFQPGSSDFKCEQYCKKNNINFLKYFCLMKTVIDNL